jgi:acetyl esterase/lipase
MRLPTWVKTWAAAISTASLFVAAVGAVASTSTTLTACTASSEKRDVVYDARFGEDTSLDVYLPDEGGEARRPTVLFIHGGSWTSGSKAHGQGLGRRLARSGYVAISINYRLVPRGLFPRNIKDCNCALAFVRAHAEEYRVDPDRIVVAGYSAGAHLASLVGVASEHPELAPDPECAADIGGHPEGLRLLRRPAAVIAGSGPQDMHDFHENVGDGIEDVLGGPPSGIPHVYDLASPTFHVKAGSPPYLIVTDLSASMGGNTKMRDKLAAVGSDVRLLKIAGSLHIIEQGTDPGVLEPGVSTDTPEAWIAIDDFLRRTVGEPKR